MNAVLLRSPAHNLTTIPCLSAAPPPSLPPSCLLLLRSRVHNPADDRARPLVEAPIGALIAANHGQPERGPVAADARRTPAVAGGAEALRNVL